jgi:hypothetical protein
MPRREGSPRVQPNYGPPPTMPVADPPKDWMTTLLLAIFLGSLGVHRFYVGKTGTGIAQIFTCGGCLVWQIVDIIAIATGSFTDAQGRPLVRTQ